MSEPKIHLQNNLPGKLLRAEEVAALLNVSRAFAFRLMQHGQIPTIRIGKSIRVRPEDLEAFIASRRNFEI